MDVEDHLPARRALRAGTSYWFSRRRGAAREPGEQRQMTLKFVKVTK
jgi:hypothetical protein